MDTNTAPARQVEPVTIHGIEINPEDYRRFIIPFERYNKQLGRKVTTEYLTVEGKLALLRNLLVALGYKSTDYSVETLEIGVHGNTVFVAKRLRVPWGVYDSVSGADTSGSDIAAGNPYEVADTSALGRCIGHAGIDILGKIESADGMNKAGYASGAEGGSRTATTQQSTYATPISEEDAPPYNSPDGTHYVCEHPGCGKEIRDGKTMNAKQLAALSMRTARGIYCFNHRKR